MSLKQLSALSVLVCTLPISGVTSAADMKPPSPLVVKGHIRAGGACDLTLGDGGVIDFGKLSNANSLKGPATQHQMSLAISCPGPTKIGFGLVDNRAGTKPADEGERSFGLGNPAIGSYSISLLSGSNRWVNGKRATVIYGYRYSDQWQRSTLGGIYLSSGNNSIYSWEVPGASPVAAGWVTDWLTIETSFKDDIAFTDELEIDGSTTLELVYL
ncbi:DUF1120 domain-containing protein [Burkholderia contaminans]|uniref:DUF1120 domain-containing protein n=1 Tax=Burkholderia contaminans TaxID=488447 RepID=UPI0009F2CA27|nr:DUF1120 domain-containing protein [Burkholderia contaminans]